LKQEKMSSTFHLRFLGPVQAEQNGEPLRGFRSRKALALLGYLVAQSQTLPREHLADLFWEDQTESRGRANLSWVLNKLNTLLPDCLETDRHNVQFQPSDSYWSDLDAFDELEARGETSALAEAVALYRGEFLEGLYLEGCAEFELWVLAERERWRQRVLRALETLVAHHSRRGEYEASLHFARRLLALEPWREETQRQVMRLLARSGQRGAALAQYEACRRLLAAELGVEPALETTALYERIRAADSLQHDLPAQTTPFLGRKEELVEIAQLLDDPDCRLLTILGPGGIGKTRLALQAGEARREAFLEGVHFVPLAALSSDDFLVSAIADALQFSLSGSGAPQIQLLNYLRGKEVLLILDNFEHLLPPLPPPPGGDGEGAKLLGEILEKAPEVKLLVTSRERLNLRWEKCFEIAGLDYPDETTPGAELQAYSAVQLFQQTARQMRQDFTLSEQDRPAVARICQLVQGLPLGIELAASWTDVYTCQKIAGEIEQGIDFLATSMRDVPQRHRSIQATFEHSWRLLTPPEQGVLMALSVFRRGFQRKAAKEVAGATPIVLKSLVDKSLLRFLPSGRYEMHEMLRQYAAEKLVAMPEAHTGARDRHCSHYVAFLEGQGAALAGTGAPEALATIRTEIGNVRAAWRWAVKEARLEEIEQGLDGLSRYYFFTGPFQEGERFIGMAVDCARTLFNQGRQSERDVQIVLSKLLAEQARFLVGRGMYDQAIVAAQEAVDQAQTSRAAGPEAMGHLQWGRALSLQGDLKAAQFQRESALGLAQGASLHAVKAESLIGLGNIFHGYSDYAKAKAYYEQSLCVSRETDNRFIESNALNNLGMISAEQGDYARGRAYYEQALQVYREIGRRWGESLALDGLGRIYADQGNYAEARGYFEQALRINREFGRRRGEGYALNDLGDVYLRQGDYARARAYFNQALQIRRELGSRWEESETLIGLGNVSAAQGDYDRARAYHQQALQINRELGNRRSESLALHNLGSVVAHLGDYAGARTCQAQALQISRELGDRPGESHALAKLGFTCARQGHNTKAQAYLEQALRICREIDERPWEAYTLSNLGYTLTESGRLAEAAEAYRQTLLLRRELGQSNLAMESLAGLACISLAQDNLIQAQARVEEILTYLESNTLDGTDEPLRIYLTCYRVLRAAQNPRAQDVLSAGHHLLQERAAKISDEELRRSFLENVAVHREIVEQALKAGLAAAGARLSPGTDP
jgi:predicted ATPase/DNA-binding SARP family transcriptional activator